MLLIEVVALPVLAPSVSPLMLADRLITLAQDADRAGFRQEANHLVAMVYSVLDAKANDRPANGRGRQVLACEPAPRFVPSNARSIPGHQRLPA